MSAARKLSVAAIAASALIATAVAPATAATRRSARAHTSGNASKHRHTAVHRHTACTHSAKRGHISRKGHASASHKGRGCVRGAHTSKPRPKSTAGEPTAQGSGASRAAAIAAVLATPCQNTELTPEAANIEAVRDAVLCLINHVRAQHGEQPLATNPDLERAALGHSTELVEKDYFAHVSPSGETPVERIRLTGYLPGPSFGYVIGENLAWGTLTLSTPAAIVNAWVNSPGHLANILEGQYEDTGIGVVPAVPPSLSGGQSGATYSQEFGVILG